MCLRSCHLFVLFRPLRRGERCQSIHRSKVSVTCLVHVTHVVSTKPRPPAARPEWLFGWGTLSSGVLFGIVVGFYKFELGLGLNTALFYSLIHPYSLLSDFVPLCPASPYSLSALKHEGTGCSQHLSLLWCSHTCAGCSGPR